MSAQPALELDVDLEANRAEGTLSIAIDELFVDGELRLWEYPDIWWEGYVLEDDEFYHVDTRYDPDTFLGRKRVGEQAVRDAIAEHIADPNAGGRGVFERGARP